MPKCSRSNSVLRIALRREAIDTVLKRNAHDLYSERAHQRTGHSEGCDGGRRIIYLDGASRGRLVAVKLLSI